MLGFLAKMNDLGSTKLQQISDQQGLLPAYSNFKELYPSNKMADFLISILREYIDSSWLRFWPVELDKKLFSCLTSDMEEQHIRLMKEFRDQSSSGNLGELDVKGILMLQLEVAPSSPNRLYLIEILVYHKLSTLSDSLEEIEEQELICSDLLFLLKAMIFYFDFENDGDLMSQRRCQQVYFTLLIYSLQVMTGFSEEGKKDLMFEAVKDLIEWLKVCISIFFEKDASILEETQKPKAPEPKFFSSVSNKHSPQPVSDQSSLLCVAFARQVLLVRPNQENSPQQFLTKQEPPAPKRLSKPISFSSKKPNLLEIEVPESPKSEFLLDREEIISSSINKLNSVNKLKKFFGQNDSLNTSHIRQQYTHKQKFNLYQLRQEVNNLLVKGRSSEIPTSTSSTSTGHHKLAVTDV